MILDLLDPRLISGHNSGHNSRLNSGHNSRLNSRLDSISSIEPILTLNLGTLIYKIMEINYARPRKSKDGKDIIPDELNILQEIGKNIRFQRLVKNISVLEVSKKAGLGRSTVHKMEKGIEGISMSNYIKVFTVLNFEKQLLEVGTRMIMTRNQFIEQTSIRKRASRDY